MRGRSTDLQGIIEQNPAVVSGAWVFCNTRVPVVALFENLRDGATIDEFLEWFPGVTRFQVETLLTYVVEISPFLPRLSILLQIGLSYVR